MWVFRQIIPDAQLRKKLKFDRFLNTHIVGFVFVLDP